MKNVIFDEKEAKYLYNVLSSESRRLQGRINNFKNCQSKEQIEFWGYTPKDTAHHRELELRFIERKKFVDQLLYKIETAKEP